MGFLGRALLDAAGRLGWRIEPIARTRAPGCHVADITDPDSLDALTLDADAVINLAARLPARGPTAPDQALMFAVNHAGASNVAQWAIRRGITRVLHASSLAVVAQPWPVPLVEGGPTGAPGELAAYPASKLAGESTAGALVRAAGHSFLAVRLAALYGPGMRWTVSSRRSLTARSPASDSRRMPGPTPISST